MRSAHQDLRKWNDPVVTARRKARAGKKSESIQAGRVIAAKIPRNAKPPIQVSGNGDAASVLIYTAGSQAQIGIAGRNFRFGIILRLLRQGRACQNQNSKRQPK